MIYHINGTVERIDSNIAVLDVMGVGYACHTSLMTLKKLKTGEKAKLYTLMYLREDICDLYGFISMEELSAFKMLIGISGVGPKAAVSILSINTPEHLALSIINGDEKALTSAAGIGKKLAGRVILELKDKLGKQQHQMSGGSVMIDSVYEADGRLGEARAALSVLGYSAQEVSMVINGLDTQDLSVEDIVRQALRQMAKL